MNLRTESQLNVAKLHPIIKELCEREAKFQASCVEAARLLRKHQSVIDAKSSAYYCDLPQGAADLARFSFDFDQLVQYYTKAANFSLPILPAATATAVSEFLIAANPNFITRTDAVAAMGSIVKFYPWIGHIIEMWNQENEAKDINDEAAKDCRKLQIALAAPVRHLASLILLVSEFEKNTPEDSNERSAVSSWKRKIHRQLMSFKDFERLEIRRAEGLAQFTATVFNFFNVFKQPSSTYSNSELSAKAHQAVQVIVAENMTHSVIVSEPQRTSLVAPFLPTVIQDSPVLSINQEGALYRSALEMDKEGNSLESSVHQHEKTALQQQTDKAEKLQAELARKLALVAQQQQLEREAAEQKRQAQLKEEEARNEILAKELALKWHDEECQQQKREEERKRKDNERLLKAQQELEHQKRELALQRKQAEERTRKTEEERRLKEQQEQKRKQEAERLKREADDRKREEEQERERKEAERLKRETEERKRQEEQHRLQEQQECLKKELQERQKRAADEKRKKALEEVENTHPYIALLKKLNIDRDSIALCVAEIQKESDAALVPTEHAIATLYISNDRPVTPSNPCFLKQQDLQNKALNADIFAYYVQHILFKMQLLQDKNIRDAVTAYIDDIKRIGINKDNLDEFKTVIGALKVINDTLFSVPNNTPAPISHSQQDNVKFNQAISTLRALTATQSGPRIARILEALACFVTSAGLGAGAGVGLSYFLIWAPPLMIAAIATGAVIGGLTGLITDLTARALTTPKASPPSPRFGFFPPIVTAIESVGQNLQIAPVNA